MAETGCSLPGEKLSEATIYGPMYIFIVSGLNINGCGQSEYSNLVRLRSATHGHSAPALSSSLVSTLLHHKFKSVIRLWTSVSFLLCSIAAFVCLVQGHKKLVCQSISDSLMMFLWPVWRLAYLKHNLIKSSSLSFFIGSEVKSNCCAGNWPVNTTSLLCYTGFLINCITL